MGRDEDIGRVNDRVRHPLASLWAWHSSLVMLHSDAIAGCCRCSSQVQIASKRQAVSKKKMLLFPFSRQAWVLFPKSV